MSINVNQLYRESACSFIGDLRITMHMSMKQISITDSQSGGKLLVWFGLY